ncbi:MAG: hypothetical protein M1829_005890 [Trizodia sp. TS-e1964]|nr:MAG: hypothetical protein M1829_005890 [Trizodia sp. TS-e1964]
MNQTITADEIALYDRQIRLWGVLAQEKIRTAKILLISIKALANEIAKNLVLAGIGSLTIVDDEIVSEEDLGAQFFLTASDIGKNRAQAAAPQIQKLNPRVTLSVDTENIRTKVSEYFKPFDIVIATDLDLATLCKINKYARNGNTLFYATGSHGFYGYIFADLIKHEYVIERNNPADSCQARFKQESTTRSIINSTNKSENGKVIETVQKRELYCELATALGVSLPDALDAAATGPLSRPLRNRKLRKVTPLYSCLRALWEFQAQLGGALPSQSKTDMATFISLARAEHEKLQLPTETLKAEFVNLFLQNVGSELAPATAFLGGQLAQDVINVLGARQQPIQNMMLFDGLETEGPVYTLHPPLTEN